MISSALVSIVHYLTAFAIFSAVVSQHLILRSGVDAARVHLLRKVNIVYAVSATVLLVFGLLRTLYFAKGWEYYKTSGAFHGKFTLFLVLAGLSVLPTILIRRWQKKCATAGQEYSPPTGEVRKALLFVRLELALLLIIVILASLMAQGIG